MKRRGFVKALAGAPAASVLLAQQPATPPPSGQQPAAPPPTGQQPVQPPPTRAADLPKIETVTADAAADPVHRFLNAQQFEALKKLSELLMPATSTLPGALDARAPEFLDFLISESPAERKQLYRAGLDGLNSQAHARFQRPFGELELAQADTLLAPLRAPWSFDPPTDPVARFLLAAKQDVRTATVNSREFSAAGASTGRRGFGGNGLYWYPLD